MLFNNGTPRTGIPTPASSAARKRTALTVGSVVAVAALAGATLLTTGAAFASPVGSSVQGIIGTASTLNSNPALAAQTAPGSYARGQFLSGVIAGLSLNDLIALQSAEARNTGSTTTVTNQDPLTLAILKNINLGAPAGIQLNLSDIIHAGALSQYAMAKSNGAAHGASGAVTNEGAIGTGSAPVGGSLDVDLEKLLGARFANVITALDLQVQAVAAQATGTTDAVSGSYSLANLNLSFTSPALASLSSKVADSLAPANASIAGLTGKNGSLVGAVNSVLTRINPILSATGSSATASASVSANLQSAVAPLLTSTYSTPGITLNLSTGSVVVDLDKFTGGSLNNQPANTELLSDAVVGRILAAITTQLTSLATQITSKVDLALANAQVAVDVNVTALSPTAGTPAVAGIPAVPPVLCTALQLLNLCKATGGTPAIPGIPAIAGNLLRSTATVHIAGTANQIIHGTAAASTANVSLLGGTVNASLSTGQILAALGPVLQAADSSALSQVTSGLTQRLLTPAFTALTGAGGSSVSSLLTGLLSLTLNVKETTLSGGGLAVPTGTLFTETALRISVLKNSGTGTLATINLAQAAVAPRISVLVDPPTGDPSPNPTPSTISTNPPGTSGCPTGTTCSTTLRPTNVGGESLANTGDSASGRLAYTGVAIGGIIFAILALLAAGVWLAREGYRRNKTAALSGGLLG
jgi:hypothetical protein